MKKFFKQQQELKETEKNFINNTDLLLIEFYKTGREKNEKSSINNY